jgi:hypothetical protein
MSLCRLLEMLRIPEKITDADAVSTTTNVENDTNSALASETPDKPIPGIHTYICMYLYIQTYIYTGIFKVPLRGRCLYMHIHIHIYIYIYI